MGYGVCTAGFFKCKSIWGKEPYKMMFGRVLRRAQKSPECHGERALWYIEGWYWKMACGPQVFFVEESLGKGPYIVQK